MSTPIHTEQVHDPVAWVGDDFTSDEDLVYRLEPRTVQGSRRSSTASAACLATHRTRARGSPRRRRSRREVYNELISGRGLVVVRGFPVEEHGVDELELLFWAWLSHFGRLVSNNSFGHRMVRVQQEVLPGGVQPARARSRRRSSPCTTTPPTSSPSCGSTRRSAGGESQFSSGPAADNTILATRPDILPILYRGFPHHRRSEQPDDQPDVTPYDVPIFSNVDGRICINFTYSSILPALHELGREMTPDEEEAIDILRRVLVRQQVELRMRPGDASMANNFAMCHSRSDFVDGPDPERRRLVLRAWTEVPLEDRRLPIGREFFHMENEGGHLGYDPVPGREGRIAINDYSNVDEDLANLFKAAQAKPRVD